MPAAETPVACLGIDVGKSSHSACALDAEGGIAFRAELANVSVNIFFTIFTNVFSPIAPTRMRRIRQRGCAAFGV